MKAPVPVGLEHNDEVLLHAYCPPYYKSMTEAVHVWVDHKFNPGAFIATLRYPAGKTPRRSIKGIARPDPSAVDAAASLC